VEGSEREMVRGRQGERNGEREIKREKERERERERERDCVTERERERESMCVVRGGGGARLCVRVKPPGNIATPFFISVCERGCVCNTHRSKVRVCVLERECVCERECVRVKE